MAITPLMFSSKKLPVRNTCNYYKETLSQEQFLKCKEYETLHNNHVNQMIVFVIIIFAIFFLIYNKVK